MAAWTSLSEDHRRVHLQAAAQARDCGQRGVSIDTVWGQGYILRETEAVGQGQASLPNSIDDVEIDEPVTKPAAKKHGSAGRGQMSATL